jgi:hypothetical protein
LALARTAISVVLRIDLFQADLVDPGGREDSCSEAAKSGLVTTFAATKGIDGE